MSENRRTVLTARHRLTACHRGMTLIELMTATALSAVLMVALSGSIALSVRVVGQWPDDQSDPIWHEALRELYQRDFERAGQWWAGPDRIVLRGTFTESFTETYAETFTGAPGSASLRTSSNQVPFEPINNGGLETIDQIEYRLSIDSRGAKLDRVVLNYRDSGAPAEHSRTVALWIDHSWAEFEILRFNRNMGRFVAVALLNDHAQEMPLTPWRLRLIGRSTTSSHTHVLFEGFVSPLEHSVE